MTSWRQRDTEKLERFGSFWKGLTLQKQWEKEISASFNVLRIIVSRAAKKGAALSPGLRESRGEQRRE